MLFVTALGPTGTFMYSTYLGGSAYDVGLSIAASGSGAAYLTGVTGSPDFPTTNGTMCDSVLCDSGFLVKIASSNLALTPSVLAFGTAAVGSTSSSQTATLTNNGSTAVTINSITASGNFTQSNTCGSSIAPAGKCQVTVSFVPNVAGSLTGSVSISASTTTSPSVLSLSGNRSCASGRLSDAAFIWKRTDRESSKRKRRRSPTIRLCPCR